MNKNHQNDIYIVEEIAKSKVNYDELNDADKEKLDKKVDNIVKRTYSATTHNWKPMK